MHLYFVSWIGLWIAIAHALVAGPNDDNSTIPEATTKNGTYYGSKSTQLLLQSNCMCAALTCKPLVHQSKWHQDYFQGIPYAQAPTGPLRFRDPQPLNTSWTGKRNATSLGHMCYGYGPTQMVLTEGQSEDCLTLNIYRTSNGSVTPASKLPVVVYIHGGQFKHGSGIDPRYNFTSLLQVGVQNRQQFIGVTINYRLSYWGFMYGKEIAEEGAANLGLKDQRLALRWVHENIEAFGGDADKVTIWGQEAGAFSVGLQLIAYGGRDDGLFRGAIAQSGASTLMWPSVTAQEWQPLYERFVEAANCSNSTNTLDCLRYVHASALSSIFSSDITTNDRPNPVVDGEFIQDLGSRELAAGHFVKVPYILGTARDEGTWQNYATKGINTTAEFLSMVSKDGISNATREKILELYPDDPQQGIPATLDGRPGNDSGLGYQWKRQSAYTGDKIMQAGRRLTSQAWAAAGVDSYSYVYDVLFHAKWWEYGAQEQDDVAFYFHNVTLSEALSPEDQADQKPTFEPLSYLMSSMWLAFINTLDPNNHPSKCRHILPCKRLPNMSIR